MLKQLSNPYDVLSETISFENIQQISELNQRQKTICSSIRAYFLFKNLIKLQTHFTFIYAKWRQSFVWITAISL